MEESRTDNVVTGTYRYVGPSLQLQVSAQPCCQLTSVQNICLPCTAIWIIILSCQEYFNISSQHFPKKSIEGSTESEQTSINSWYSFLNRRTTNWGETAHRCVFCILLCLDKSRYQNSFYCQVLAIQLKWRQQNLVYVCKAGIKAVWSGGPPQLPKKRPPRL